MATITTNEYLDDNARTSGEAFTINGAVLTIRTDTRVHANSPASMTGSIGTCTISSTLGGGVVLDGRNVRCLAYNSGSGTVPAIGTTITQGGISGYLLGVWADWASAPTAVGASMPTSGYLKFREVTGGAFSAGALTGIGASATGADVVGWIEVVMRQSTTQSIPRLGYFQTRGDWFELGTTNGSAGQTFQVPTNGGGTQTYVPAVWIETSAGSGEYEIYPAVYATWFNNTNLGTDKRCKFVQTVDNGVIRIGNDGTNDCGFVPASGCKVRIPNVFGRQTTATNDALNLEPHTSLATRPDFTTTASGVIDIEHFLTDWYLGFSSAYEISLSHSAAFDTYTSSNDGAAFTITDFATGVYTTTSVVPLSLTSCLQGGTITNSKFFRGNAVINGYPLYITSSFGIELDNIHTGVLTYARSSGDILITQCDSFTFGIIYKYACSLTFTTSSNITVDWIDHTDRLIGTTNTTTGKYGVLCAATCNKIKVNKLTLGLDGLISNVNPYLAIYYSINSNNIKYYNAGTISSPLSIQSGAEPAYLFHDAGVNNGVTAKRLYGNTRSVPYLSTVTSKNIIIENVQSNIGAPAILAADTLVKGTKAASFTGNGNSVYGSHYFDAFYSDTLGVIGLLMNEPTSTSSVYVTTSLGAGAGFTSTGNISIPNVNDTVTAEMPYFALGHLQFLTDARLGITGINVQNFDYDYQIDTGSGFSAWKQLCGARVRASGGAAGATTVNITAVSGSRDPQIGDYVGTTSGTHFTAGTTITNIVGNTLTFSDPILASLSSQTIIYWNEIASEPAIDPSTGVKLSIRVTNKVASSTNALTNIFLFTQSSLVAQGNLYQLEYCPISLTGLLAGTRVQIYDVTNNEELYNDVLTGTSLSLSVPYNGDFTCRVRAMKFGASSSYMFEEFSTVVSSDGLSSSVIQELDTVYNTNAIDGGAVTGITIDDTLMLVETEIGTVTWAEIYAYETYWLSTEEGIRDEGRFIEAVDTANYKLFDFKIKNISSPSEPLIITGGYGVDGDTGQTLDLIDTTGGTIFCAPDHVVAIPSIAAIKAKTDNLPDDPASEASVQEAINKAKLAAALSA